MTQKYKLQLIPFDGQPKELPWFDVVSRQEAFRALFDLAAVELGDDSSSIEMLLLFERKCSGPVGELRLRDRREADEKKNAI